MSCLTALHLYRITVLCTACVFAGTNGDAQPAPTVIAISGELNATPLSRSVAQRTATLLRRAHSEFTVVPADTIAWFMDLTAWRPRTPAMPQDLREVCREFRASLIIDIMMSFEQHEYRGVAYRLVHLRQPSKGVGTKTALLMIGQAVASTADSVARELVPQIVESLGQKQTAATSVAPAVRCLDFTDVTDSAPRAPGAPSNTHCC